nr:protein argonaute MEL1-like [Aegilops tauschii subsp. strangulata]
MAYRGGGGRGAPAGGGRGATGWRPPRASSAPRPAATAPVLADNPNATGPHQGAYQHGVVVRNPGPVPYATVRAPSPAVTTRAPSPTPATVRASPAATPLQPARVSAPAPAPPTPAAVAKELEQKLFITETALAPPATAAVAATQEGQPEAEKAPEVELAPVSKKVLAHPARPSAGTVGKTVMIRANHFLVNVANKNLFHYDVSCHPQPPPPPCVSSY